jgi:hypothetical protein
MSTALSDGNVSAEEKAKFEALFEELNFEGVNFEDVFSSMQNLGTSFDELANSAYAVVLAEE